MKIAVIPARGGSKRIFKKNIKDFLGKPIISYSIDAAISSKCFDLVIASTDDREIADIAEQYGAKVPFYRPAELSDDFTGTNAVVAHAIAEVEAKMKVQVSHACCLYATAPFVTSEVIQQGLALLNGNASLDYAITVTSFPFPIQRAITLEKNTQVMEMLYPQHRMTRSQDLDEMYHDAGQVYWGDAAAFTQNKPMFDSNCAAIIQPRHRVQDIDTPEDWLRAEMLYRVWSEMGKP